MKTTEDILRAINNSTIKTITEFINKAQKIFPDISQISIVKKQDMGISGILAWAEFNFNSDRIIVKGFLFPNKLWSEETHGYIIAKKI